MRFSLESMVVDAGLIAGSPPEESPTTTATIDVEPSRVERDARERELREAERRAAAVDTRARLLEDVRAFETVLEMGAEAPIQQFFEDHPQVLLHTTDSFLLKPKFCLADEFQTDFLTLGRSRSTWLTTWRSTFIEIERASGALFTKKGDPTAFLVHAIRQVQDWKAWNARNRDFLANRLEKLVTEAEKDGELLTFLELNDRHFGSGLGENYLIIAGRHRDLSVADMIRLAQMNDDLNDIAIVTYDKVIENLVWGHGFWWDGKFVRSRLFRD